MWVHEQGGMQGPGQSQSGKGLARTQLTLAMSDEVQDGEMLVIDVVP